MCDEALSKNLTDDPRLSPTFNDVLARSIWNGRSTILNTSEIVYFSDICGIQKPYTSNITLLQMYNMIRDSWFTKWNGKGDISKKLIEN
jgi:hypothetical protein